MEADNVDYDTPKNKAIELSNFDRNDVLKSYYKYDKYVSTILILMQNLQNSGIVRRPQTLKKKLSPGFWNYLVQVNLFQMHLFLHQLTHNMTQDFLW